MAKYAPILNIIKFKFEEKKMLFKSGFHLDLFLYKLLSLREIMKMSRYFNFGSKLLYFLLEIGSKIYYLI